jgi:8-oxo-dGTP pyrophosphatase MutT (NUDIX family)
MPVPDYIVKLRQQVGHDCLWLPGVTAVVLRDAEVLLVKRSDNGEWSPVTGIVDPGEHPATCAIREVLEETGVEAELELLTSVNVTPAIVHANGDLAQYLDHTFRCRYLSGEARVGDDESTAVAWFPQHDLPAMNPEVTERLLAALHHEGPTRIDA